MHRRRSRARAARAAAVALLLAASLTACGGDGPIDIPSPTGSVTGSLATPTRSPTRSPSREPDPSTSASPSETPSDSVTPEPSESPAESESPDASSEPPTEPSEEPTKSEPEETETPTASPSQGEADDADSAEEDGLPSWLWWLLGGLLLSGVVLAAILIPRARRRSAWDARLTGGRAEVMWFAQELMPTLQQSASPDEVAGGWNLASVRVRSAEDDLTVLEASAPDGSRRDQARTLRDGVRTATQSMEDLLVARDPATFARDLASIETMLVTALKPATPGGGPTHAS